MNGGNRNKEARSSPLPFLASDDIAIIGGGVADCAVARRMVLAGASVVLIAKTVNKL